MDKEKSLTPAHLKIIAYNWQLGKWYYPGDMIVGWGYDNVETVIVCIKHHLSSLNNAPVYTSAENRDCEFGEHWAWYGESKDYESR